MSKFLVIFNFVFRFGIEGQQKQGTRNSKATFRQASPSHVSHASAASQSCMADLEDHGNRLSEDSLFILENSIVRQVLNDRLSGTRLKVDVLPSCDDTLETANKNAWKDLQALQGKSQKFTERACTRLGKRTYGEHLNIVAPSACDIAEYINQRTTLNVFCSNLEAKSILCLDNSKLTTQQLSMDNKVIQRSAGNTVTFVDLNQSRMTFESDENEDWPPFLLEPITQMHRLDSDALQALRQTKDDGALIRKRETMIIDMCKMPDMLATFSMRETMDNTILFFATFYKVKFKGLENPLSCPFCRSFVELDLCSLREEMLDHMDSGCKAWCKGVSKGVSCCMIGCDNRTEFMPALSCPCHPTFCYECVWKYVTGKQDLSPILLNV